MKKRAFFLILFLLAVVPAFAAPDPADYRTLASALENSIERVRQMPSQKSGYDVVFRRDPAQPLVASNGRLIYPAGLHSGLMVQGIIQSGGEREVLVNDLFYQEGQQAGPYRIVEIQTDGVKIEDPAGAESFARLYPDAE